jgi:hypothetical protein
MALHRNAFDLGHSSSIHAFPLPEIFNLIRLQYKSRVCFFIGELAEGSLQTQSGKKYLVDIQ